MGLVPPGQFVAVMGACLLLLAVMPAAGPRAANGDIWQIRESSSRILAAPRAGADVVLRLQPEHRMVEFARRGDWLRVGVFRRVGIEGWIPVGSVVRSPVAARAEAGDTLKSPQEELASIDREEGTAETFELVIRGRPGLAFKGTCRAVGRVGIERRLSISGHVPARFSFRAAALSCRVRKWDARGRFVAVLLRAGRTIADARTSAPYNLLRVRSEGPWGAALAERDRGALFTPRPVIVPPSNPAIPEKVLSRPR